MRSVQGTIRSGRATAAGVVAASLLVACSGDAGGAVDRVGDVEVAAQQTEQDQSEQDQTEQDRRVGGVTVVGEGRASAVPDSARVLVGVGVTSPDVGAAFGEANDVMADVLDALREQGVADEHLRTRELSVSERRDDRPPAPPPDDPPPARPPDEPIAPPGDANEPEVIAYTVANQVEVTIRELDRAGEIISAAVDVGGPAIRIQRFSLAVDDDAMLLDDARRAAFADAERRAAQYAELAGRDLGEVIAISEVIGSPGPVPVPEIAHDGRVAAPIEPGQQEAVVRIQTTWALD